MTEQWFATTGQRPNDHSAIVSAAEQAGITVDKIKLFRGAVGIVADSNLSESDISAIETELSNSLNGEWTQDAKPSDPLNQ